MKPTTQNFRFLDPYAEFYYLVLNGKNTGIYTSYDLALEAAWTSDYDIRLYKTKTVAISNFKKPFNEQFKASAN